MRNSSSEQEGRSAVGQEKKPVQKREKEGELMRLAQSKPKSYRKDLKKGIVFGNPKNKHFKTNTSKYQVVKTNFHNSTTRNELVSKRGKCRREQKLDTYDTKCPSPQLAQSHFRPTTSTTLLHDPLLNSLSKFLLWPNQNSFPSLLKFGITHTPLPFKHSNHLLSQSSTSIQPPLWHNTK